MKFRIYNRTLDPVLWDENQKLKPEIRDALLQIAQDFYHSTDFISEIQDILLLGSSVNYNWTPHSDIDLHVVIDIAQEKINDSYARKFMDSLSAKWNNEHEIEIKGKKVEVYLQDVREPNSTAETARKSSAIYSIIDDKWILEPQREKIELDRDVIVRKYTQLSDKIEKMVGQEDTEKLKKLMKSIRNYRDAGLTKAGEFSTENIVFKLLRRTGMLKKLKDTITQLYDRETSLTESLEDNQPFLVVGAITDDLKVYSLLTRGPHSHIDLCKRYGINPIRFDRFVHWRYNSKINTIYWFENDITDKEKFVVKDHLKHKYNVTSPQDIVGSKEKYFGPGHILTEKLMTKILDRIWENVMKKVIYDS